MVPQDLRVEAQDLIALGQHDGAIDAGGYLIVRYGLSQRTTWINSGGRKMSVPPWGDVRMRLMMRRTTCCPRMRGKSGSSGAQGVCARARAAVCSAQSSARTAAKLSGSHWESETSTKEL